MRVAKTLAELFDHGIQVDVGRLDDNKVRFHGCKVGFRLPLHFRRQVRNPRPTGFRHPSERTRSGKMRRLRWKNARFRHFLLTCQRTKLTAHDYLRDDPDSVEKRILLDFYRRLPGHREMRIFKKPVHLLSIALSSGLVLLNAS